MSVRLVGYDDLRALYDNDESTPVELEDDNLGSSPENVFSVIMAKVLSLIHDVHRKRIYRLTIIHYILLIVWFTFLIVNIAKYQENYKKSRLRASRILNTILFGCSDILAQSVSCYFSENIDPIPQVVDSTTHDITQRFQNNIFHDDIDLDTGYESDTYSVINDYGENVYSSREGSTTQYNDELDDLNEPNKPNLTTFKFIRFATFSLWGQIISFFQVPWYRILNLLFTDDPSAVQVFERVLADQFLYSPIFLYFFFAYSNFVMERGDSKTFKVKIQKLYISTLGCNFMVWPLAQLINFSFIPKSFQIPFSSSIGVLWNCFLSMRNASSSKSL